MDVLLILLMIGIAFLYFHLASPTVVGAAGERRINWMLSRKLDARDYIILEDLTLPTVSGTTQVDHIVLSRFGVFVIETKNMSGWIFGGKTQASWTQVMRSHKSQFQNPLRQNYHHIKVVQNLLGLRLEQLENLVAFVGTAVPKTEMPANVFWHKRDLLSYIASRKTVQFTEDEVLEFERKLRVGALEANKETRRAHVQHVREKATRKKADLANCPKCGSKMIERSNRETWQNFLGCSNYPKCRGTRQMK